ncbi:yrdC domain-containing protein, mitochondrial isoform X2 [Zalophus californianus]|uniref:Threonylcarbamoyl-AMP synthase n=1 Tax=Zalophus californianus TaxID=9704 RepID=A0A6J2DE64_ZALCA|nr:yrdC domain-containing protein, mitochondrial isoform X2 [Zalophus californianus]
MSPARPCRGMRAAVAASVGLSEGPAGSARRGRLLRPPSPAPAAPGARLLRLPGSGAVRAANPERAGWTEALRAAVAELRAGAVVAVPTDTLYGLACSASCSAALGAVYRLKGRSEDKPLAVCLGRVADVYRYCHVRVPEGLLKDLLPGPVTLVLERSKELNKDLNPFTPLVGIRIPDHAFIQDLVQVFGGPLALTSANLSSQASSLNVEMPPVLEVCGLRLLMRAVCSMTSLQMLGVVSMLPLPLLRSSRTSGLSCPWSLMGDQLGMARAPSIAWAQLWLICLYLESLASFVQAVPWRVPQPSSSRSTGCSPRTDPASASQEEGRT